MNVLMIGNTASVGWNLVKGITDTDINVTFVGNHKDFLSGTYDYILSWKDFLHKNYGKTKFNIIHIQSPNLKKLGAIQRYMKNAKLVCHWHGSDLRIPRKAFPVYKYLKKHGDYHLYSTVDLRWWLRTIPEDQKERFICPIDTEQFKPMGEKTNNNILIQGGGGGYSNYRIIHDDMPKFISQYKTASINDKDFDNNLLSVMALEAASCDVKVKEYPWMDREWVIENASIKSQTPKIIKIYERLIND